MHKGFQNLSASSKFVARRIFPVKKKNVKGDEMKRKRNVSRNKKINMIEKTNFNWTSLPQLGKKHIKINYL